MTYLLRNSILDFRYSNSEYKKIYLKLQTPNLLNYEVGWLIIYVQMNIAGIVEKYSDIV